MTTEVPEIVVTIEDPAPPIVVTVAAPAGPVEVTVSEVGLVGPPGTGSGGITSPDGLTAGHILSGHRLVVPSSGDSVIYADHDNLSDLACPVWLTLGAAVEDAPVDLAVYGAVTEGSWAWTLGPIYVGDGGLLVQTPPTTGYVRQVATAVDTDTIWLDPQPGIALS